MKSKCSVLAVYDDEAAREIAMKFCDALVQRFWMEFTLQMSWSRWSELEHARTAEQVRFEAQVADLIVIAAGARGVLSEHVSGWLETALRQRAEREGVLVGLPLTQPGDSSEASATQVYLRKLAHQNGMDYLTAVPQSLPHPESDSAEEYNARATQVTSVLNTILHHSHVPPRML